MKKAIKKSVRKMPVKNGIYDKIMLLMRKDPSKLFTPSSIIKITKQNYKGGKNALDYLYRSARIMRHNERAENGEFQYAVELPEDVGQRWKKTVRADKGINAISYKFSALVKDAIELEELVLNTVNDLKDRQAELDAVSKVIEQIKKKT